MSVLTAEAVAKTYNGRRVVNGVNIEVRGGEIVGLLGPNGAGKTTTFHIMVGLVQPDEGKVLLNDQDLTGAPIYQRARAGISYLPQESSVFRRLTVEENLFAILQTLDLSGVQQQERCEALMKMLGVDHLADHKAFTLSGGERRTSRNCPRVGSFSLFCSSGRTFYRCGSHCRCRNSENHPSIDRQRNRDSHYGPQCPGNVGDLRSSLYS